MGIVTALKNFAPFLFYFSVWSACFLAIFGKGRYSFLLLVFLFPLRNFVERLYLYPMGKDVLDILIICLLIGNFIFAGSEKRPAFGRSSLNWIAAAVIIYILGSYLYGRHNLGEMIFYSRWEDTGLQNWKNFSLFPILAVLAFNVFRDEKWGGRVFMAMCVAMVAMDYYTVTQISWFSSLESRDKIKGTFVNLGPNEVAAFYNQFTILLCGVWFFLKNKGHKLLLAGLITANIYCVLFLFSRGAYIGLAVGLFFLFAVRKKVLLIPLILALVLWQTVLPEKVKERIEQTHNEAGELDASSALRLQVWEKAWEMFQGNPIAGLGFGTFRHQGLVLGDVHNIYLKILAEQGILGFFLFVIIIIFFLRQGWGLYKNAPDGPAKGLGLGFVGCVITLLVNNMFGDRWSYLELSAYLWIFAGLVTRLNIIYPSGKRDSLQTVKTKGSLQPNGKYK